MDPDKLIRILADPEMDWRIQVVYLKEFHDGRMRRHPKWTITLTAQALGITIAEVSEKLLIAKHIAELVHNIGYSEARSIARRLEAYCQKEVLEGVKNA